MTSLRTLCLLLLPLVGAERSLFQPAFGVVPAQAVYASPQAIPVYVAQPPAATVASRSSVPTALLLGAFVGTAAATLAFGGRRARLVKPRLPQSSLRMQGAGTVKTKKIF